MNLRTLWCADNAKSNHFSAARDVFESVELAAKVVQETRQIEHFCSTLIRTKAHLFVHSDRYDGEEPIFMVSMSDKEVVLEMPAPAASAMTSKTEVIDLTTTAPGGAALFTLPNFRMTTKNVARASRPELIIRTQSREHFRMSGKRGARQLAHLLVADTSNQLLLHDLSEAGLCFHNTQPIPRNVQSNLQAVLMLEDTPLTIPSLRIVRETLAAPSLWRYGASMQGLQESDLRTLRRWIQQVETHPTAMRYK